jgi:hypothetical protein
MTSAILSLTPFRSPSPKLVTSSAPLWSTSKSALVARNAPSASLATLVVPTCPLLRDLQPVAAADYVMVEATYGNRLAPEARPASMCSKPSCSPLTLGPRALARLPSGPRKSVAPGANTGQGSGVILIPGVSRWVGLRLCSTTSAS